MAGAKVTIDIQDDEIGPALQRLLEFDGKRLTLALEDIGEYLVRSHRDRTRKELAPDGSRWVALTPRYLAFKKRKRPNRPKLRFDNQMLGSRFASQVVGEELFVGTSAGYGALHQFGGRKGMKPGPAAVPARPWLGLSQVDEEEVVTLVAEHLDRAARGGDAPAA